MRKILSVLATLLIGIYFGYLLLVLVISIFSFPVYFYAPSIKDLYKEDWVLVCLAILLFVLIGICVFIVHKAKKDHNELYNVFRPTWKKFLITSTCLLILIAINTLSYKGHLAAFRISTGSYISLTNNYHLLFLSILFNFLILYPFSAVLYSLIAKKKNKKQKSKRPVKLYIFLLLLFNPYFFQVGAAGYGGYSYAHNIYKNNLTKCGAHIFEVEKDSPADKAGLTRLDVISSIEGISVKTPDDLVRIFSKFEDNKPKKIKTNLDIYTVIPKKDPKTGKYLIGITISQGYCK